MNLPDVRVSIPPSRWTMLAFSTIGLGPLTQAAPAPTPPPAIVRQVDHLLLSSPEAGELFSLLTDIFQLPVAWPLSDYGRFGSGGVALGNVNLEILRAAGPDHNASSHRFVGLALEPAPLPTSLRELERRNLPHGPAIPFRSRELSRLFATLWTTVALPDVSHDLLEVFLCDYTHDVTARRQRLQAQLRASDGGPLTIHSVREIVIGAKDVNGMKARWQKLLEPRRPSSDGAWPLGDGPALRVVEAETDAIRAVVINVSSLKAAADFLRQHDLLGTELPTSMTVASRRFPGFELTLVASTPAAP